MVFVAAVQRVEVGQDNVSEPVLAGGEEHEEGRETARAARGRGRGKRT